MLAGTLKGIIGQRLIRTKDGERVAACEVMVTTGRIQDFITDPAQTGQIQQAIAEGAPRANTTVCRPSIKPC